MLLITPRFSLPNQIAEEFGKEREKKSKSEEWSRGQVVLRASLCIPNPNKPVRELQVASCFLDKDIEAQSGEMMPFSTAASM